ncbi:MAG: hypothetical protein WC879_13120 [Melioribacteraceae bacterium]
MQFIELARVYRNIFGFNVLPIQGKRPTIAWENWQLIKQTENSTKRQLASNSSEQ